MIGVDTPEVHESEKLRRDAARTKQDVATIQALGRQASAFTKRLVHAGKQVRLEFDQQARDKYRRLLAFVWLSDGCLLNETIICEGYSPAFTRYPFRETIWSAFGPVSEQRGKATQDCGERSGWQQRSRHQSRAPKHKGRCAGTAPARFITSPVVPIMAA